MRLLLCLALLVAVCGCEYRMRYESKPAQEEAIDWSWLKTEETFHSRPVIEPYTFKVDGTDGACAMIRWHFGEKSAPHGHAFVKLELTESFAKHWEIGTAHGFSIDQNNARENSVWGEMFDKNPRIKFAHISDAKSDRFYVMCVPLYPVKGNEQSVADAAAEMDELSPVWPIEPSFVTDGVERFIPKLQAEAAQ